ncbi:2,3-diaminopropionate biosynthesis protein SbnA [Lentzea pudingi]|uniref:2,3-diaminopropionate biosynthesis protein SbnA n=1 Tax=Lentzea pudingi TaxID=1789439 RepID=UPI00166C3957|nr:2,3-diaminopropionate biosynthesis protein SbnA [Lentzea pudingi]
MPVLSAPHELIDSDLYVDLAPLFGRGLLLKCEGLNFGGSVKMRAAAAMVAAAEKGGLLGPDSALIESSSGNLGVALSVIAASKGLRFTCVTDRRCNQTTLSIMRSLGADVVVVDDPARDGGLLAARLERVRELCARDHRYVWLNQYTNPANWQAHYAVTAAGIANRFPDLDVLFVGTGTGGTVMGCAKYFRAEGGTTRVIAVDAEGSVSFGHPAAARLVPGLGASVRPPMLEPEFVADVVLVSEVDTVRTCRTLSSRGLLLGGSTGTVVAGALAWLRDKDPGGSLSAVAISADMGERYLDTIYDDAWVLRHFGPEGLLPMDPAFAPPMCAR